MQHKEILSSWQPDTLGSGWEGFEDVLILCFAPAAPVFPVPLNPPIPVGDSKSTQDLHHVD